MTKAEKREYMRAWRERNASYLDRWRAAHPGYHKKKAALYRRAAGTKKRKRRMVWILGALVYLERSVTHGTTETSS